MGWESMDEVRQGESGQEKMLPKFDYYID